MIPWPKRRGLQPLVVQVRIEDVGDRGLEAEVDHLLVAAEDLLDLGPGGGIPDPGVALALAQQLADVVEELLVCPVALDVLGRDAEVLQARLRLCIVQPLPECGPVLERDPEVRVGDPVAQPAAPELELIDHEVVEQADDVGAGTDDEALVSERALERRGAAQPLPALEHQHALAGTGQVGRGRQAVVPATHDDDVPVARRQVLHRRRQAHLTEVGRDLVHVSAFK